MTPLEAFQKLNSLFQPSFIKTLVEKGSRGDWIEIDALFQIAGKAFVVDKEEKADLSSN